MPVLGRPLVVRAVLAPHALVAGPGMDECAVHAEVLARQQPLPRAISTVELNNSVTASRSMSRSRFLLNTERFHTVSSLARLTKQRNSTL
jgi:hypothetical protein